MCRMHALRGVKCGVDNMIHRPQMYRTDVLLAIQYTNPRIEHKSYTLKTEKDTKLTCSFIVHRYQPAYYNLLLKFNINKSLQRT